MRFLTRLLVIPALTLVSYLSDASPIEIPNTTASYKLDAKLDDPIWQSATKVELLYQTDPEENVAATVKTEVYLAENGTHLIVGFMAYDPEPDNIRAFLRDRDSAYDDDFVGVVLDTFNDEKRAFEFFVNPLGAQMDMIIDDIADNEDDSWNATWASNGRITDEGFVVEMAIPLNILRFRPGLEKQIWGIDILRFRPRSVRERISITKKDRDISCYLCQLPKIEGFRNAKPSRNLEIVPSLVVSESETRDLDENELWESESDVEPGLDVRWGVTPSSTVNLTLNPDFSQVEADAAQLDVNTTFSLFFPERRPFFLDSADYFDSFVNVVHTRNIAEPNVGFKFTNKSGANTTGVILADDEKTTFILPSDNGSSIESVDTKSKNAVVRYRRDLDKKSTLGVITTLKTADDYQNMLVGIDGKYRFSDSDTILVQLMATDTENPDEIIDSEDDDPLKKNQDDTGLRIRYNHGSRNWFAYSEYSEYGEDFRADLGFVSRVDYDFKLIGLGRKWHGTKDTWWNRIQVSGDYDVTHRGDGQLLEREFEMYANIKGPLQSFYEIGMLDRTRFFEDELFDEEAISFYFELKPISGLNFGMWSRVGDGIDFDNNQKGDLILAEPWINWNIGRHLQTRLDVNFQKLDVDEGEIFNASSIDLRLTYQFSNRSFLRFSAQQTRVKRDLDLYNDPDDFDSDSKFLNRQLLYSYKLTPQTVFFLGYSDGGRDTDDQTRFEKENKSVFMKFSYAWLP